MKAVVQRVSSGRVEVDDRAVGSIEQGLVILLAVERDDDEADRRWMAEKLTNLRIFCDDDGKMNRCVLDIGGGVLLVPNFTVAGNCRKGRRPSFDKAMRPPDAEAEFQAVAESIRSLGAAVETGIFGAHMHVSLVNDGPVTLFVDSHVRHTSRRSPT
ncbi:MAG: D-tyrosyl-tRNA(Tyr) deacylase [Phycisphaerales bacterium]|nr:D-tyrosyl-tRNA(Tyr) deacylase [Phycisphaerales bacterium]